MVKIGENCWKMMENRLTDRRRREMWSKAAQSRRKSQECNAFSHRIWAFSCYFVAFFPPASCCCMFVCLLWLLLLR